MFLESQIEHSSQKGSIEVICGSMFSGKTEELLRRLKRAKYAKLKIKIFKPKIDTRYAERMVVSHDDNFIDSLAIDNTQEILQHIQGMQVVALDEVQFFDKNLVAICDQMANQGIRVIAAGLDMDFMGNPFGPMPELLAIADYVTKLHAICVDCGNNANFSYRKSKDAELIQLGEHNQYKPLCRSCYNKNKY